MTQVLPIIHPPPPTREDAPAVLAHVLAVLKATVVGDDGGPLERALARLAVQATAWYCLDMPLRVLLAGPTGSGKSLVARVIADALHVPSLRLSVTDMAESTWAGPQLGETLRELCAGATTAVPQGLSAVEPVRTVAPRGVLVLDELCKLALATHGDHRHTRESASWRRGRQETLLPLLDPEGVLTTTSDRGAPPLRIASRGIAVVSTGAFAMLPSGASITSTALVDIGFLPELVDRIGGVVTLPEVGVQVRTHLVQVRAEGFRALADALGVPHALACLPDAIARLDTKAFAGPRSLAHAVEGLACDNIVRALLR